MHLTCVRLLASAPQLLEKIYQRAQARAQPSSSTRTAGNPKQSSHGRGRSSGMVSKPSGSARQESSGGKRSKNEYRKDSVDRQSMITQALFQEAQRERIRVADRDGKEEIVYLAANVSAPDILQWPVTCDLGDIVYV